jgi:cobalamin biosynthesis Mg chelatase CobN
MHHRLALLAFLFMIAIAGATGMSAQAQDPAPAGWLTAGTLGTLAMAQAPSAADSSGSQSSGSQSSTSSTQSSSPSSDATTTRHESTTTTSWPVSPLWIAIGAIALVALIALIVASSRKDSGSTTTVVK